MNPNPYFIDILKNELSLRQSKNPKYSLRSFAKFINIDPSTLSRILSGQKIPSQEQSLKIISKLKLTTAQKRQFLKSIGDVYTSKMPSRKNAKIEKILIDPLNRIVEQEIPTEIFASIADWYHYAILQLMRTDRFKSDPLWIANQLRINEEQVVAAVDRMVKLKIIEISNGKIFRIGPSLTTGDTQKTSEAFKQRIKQITKLSTISLDRDDIKIRSHTTMTMAIDPAKMSLAKEMIQDFMDLLEISMGPKKKSVYELQINFFPLQETINEPRP